MFFYQGHNNPPEVCPIVVECAIPQVLALMGIILVGSLTALNNSVVLTVKNSRGGTCSPWLSLKGIGHVDGPLLSRICLFAPTGMLSVVLIRIFRSWALLSGLYYWNWIRSL